MFRNFIYLIKRSPLSCIRRRTSFRHLLYSTNTTATTATTTAQVHQDGKTLSLSNNQNTIGGNYHVKWLRHNCQCPQCSLSYGQKTVTGDELMYNMSIQKTHIDGNKLFIEWEMKASNNCMSYHKGHLDIDWLLSQNSLKEEEKKSMTTPTYPTTTIPLMSYDEVMNNNEAFYKWLYHLADNGLCILTGVPTNEEHTLKVGGKIGNIQDTIYGQLFDVKVEKNLLTNIAYSEVGLEMHMDLQYYQSPPGLQILHCYKNDSCIEGGESTLLDGLGIVEQLRVTHPKHFNTLAKVHVPFEKLHFDRDTPVSMLYRKPHIEVDSNGMVIGINWAPAHQGTLSVYEEDIEDYYEAYVHLFELFNESPLTMVYKLKPGDLLSFNNRRILHGRKEYKLNGGERHLKGFYVNIDVFASKLAIMRRLLGKTDPLKHVLNTCYY